MQSCDALCIDAGFICSHVMRSAMMRGTLHEKFQKLKTYLK